MGQTFLYLLMRSFICLSFLAIVLLFPFLLRASTSMPNPGSEHLIISPVHHAANNLSLDVTEMQQRQDKKKQTSKKEAKDIDNKQVEPIKQVPKSRKQLKPAVVKPTVKVKPIKVIRPKIKKP